MSEQKSLEDKLRKTEERLSLAVDQARVGFYDWDIPTDDITFSDRMIEDWGISPNPGIQRPLEAAFEHIHPDDRERVNEKVQNAMKDRTPYHIEYRIVHPSGEVKWMDVHGTITYDENNKPVRFFGTSVDISKRKMAEEALKESEYEMRAFVEAMPHMAFVADAEGNILYFNQRHYDYFSVKRGDSENWAWKDQPLHHPDDLNRTIETWTHSIHTGDPYEIEYRLRRADGEFRWHLGRANPLRDKNGKITRWIGTNTDIHDQKQDKERIEHLNQTLKNALEVRDEFLSMASHELKTPLTSMKLNTQILGKKMSMEKEGLNSEKIMKFLDQSEKQMNRISKLVDDMMDITRIRTGKLPIEPDKFVLNDFLLDIKSRFEESFIKTTGSELIYDNQFTTAGIWDRARLDQVISNLLSNALRYGNNKPVTMRVMKAGNYVRVCVIDQGMGVREENHQKIFERFERAGIALSDISGLGLGLYISKQIVEAHGGRIWVESDGKNGSRFIVELPLDNQSTPKHVNFI